MRWKEVSVATSPEAGEAVSACLIRLGAGGVVVEEPGRNARARAAAELDLFPEDLPEPTQYAVRAYLACGDGLAARLTELNAFVARLSGFGLDPGPKTVTTREIDDEDWAESWKAYFHPLHFGRLVICPSWEEYRPAPDEAVVRIDPGMAFGTGNHPSTALCLQALAAAVRPGAVVADVGTGSGVLAVAALKLGAARVFACDLDPMAVRIAQENAAHNGVAERLEARAADAADFLAGLPSSPDLVVVNIIAEVIAGLAPDLASAAPAGGLLLAAGIIAEKTATVTEALTAAGLEIDGVQSSEGWSLVRAVKP